MEAKPRQKKWSPMKRKQPRKVLILDADVHAAVKDIATCSGMKFQSLGNAVLRSWHRGERFVCSGIALESKSATQPGAKA